MISRPLINIHVVNGLAVKVRVVDIFRDTGILRLQRDELKLAAIEHVKFHWATVATLRNK